MSMMPRIEGFHSMVCFNVIFQFIVKKMKIERGSGGVVPAGF